jgi:hypothetical protein
MAGPGGQSFNRMSDCLGAGPRWVAQMVHPQDWKFRLRMSLPGYWAITRLFFRCGPPRPLRPLGLTEHPPQCSWGILEETQ